MFKFILSRFINKEKAGELLEEHQETIENIAGEKTVVGKGVRLGFKIFSLWRILIFCWWGFLALLFLGAVYLVYRFVMFL